MKLNSLKLALLVLALWAPAFAQSTAFSYQGSLNNGATPANGAFDLQFRLYDALSGGAQVGPTVCSENVNVVNGVFSASLDFGAQFGGQRYLEIWARADTGSACGISSGYTVLQPRQLVAAVPYSTNALNLGGQPGTFYTNASNLVSGTIPDARLGSNIALKNGSNTFSGQNFFTSNANEFRGDGASLTNLNASQVLFGTIGDGILSSNIPKLNAANNFSNQNNFAFGARTLQFRNDSGIVPGLNLTGTSGNLGILRIRNALEIWPSDDATRAGKIDIRNNSGSPTVTLNGANGDISSTGTVTAASMTAMNLPALAYKECDGPMVVVGSSGPLNVTLCTITVNVPSAGVLYIEGRVLNAPFGSSEPLPGDPCYNVLSDFDLKLDEVFAGGGSANLAKFAYWRFGIIYTHHRVVATQNVSSPGQKSFKIDWFKNCGPGGVTVGAVDGRADYTITVWYYPSLMNAP